MKKFNFNIFGLLCWNLKPWKCWDHFSHESRANDSDVVEDVRLQMLSFYFGKRFKVEINAQLLKVFSSILSLP